MQTWESKYIQICGRVYGVFWLKQIILLCYLLLLWFHFLWDAIFYIPCVADSTCVTEGNEQKRKRVKTESDISRLTPNMRSQLEACASLKGEQVCICTQVWWIQISKIEFFIAFYQYGFLSLSHYTAHMCCTLPLISLCGLNCFCCFI